MAINLFLQSMQIILFSLFFMRFLALRELTDNSFLLFKRVFLNVLELIHVCGS